MFVTGEQACESWLQSLAPVDEIVQACRTEGVLATMGDVLVHMHAVVRIVSCDFDAIAGAAPRMPCSATNCPP